jgi:hypothetical protein
MGLAVTHGVAIHVAFINVEIERGLTVNVDTFAPSVAEVARLQAAALASSATAGSLATAATQASPMSSLVAERGRPVRMTSVRAALVSHLADAFECPRQNVQTGYPLLAFAQAS